jgi:hypothetical protein
MTKQLKFDFWKKRKKTLSDDTKIVLENNKNFWQKQAQEMFAPENTVFFFRGERTYKEKAVAEFERASGFKLNELLGGQDE